MNPLGRATLSAAPESPRSSQSPVPTGIQGDLELELLGLATTLYNLGTTVVNDSTKEKAKVGPSGEVVTTKPVGQRVNDVIGHLMAIEDISSSVKTLVPMQILQDIDNGRNPMQLTKDRLERAATENQFMNGKIHAIESYRNMLDASLCEHFPELAPHIMAQHSAGILEPFRSVSDQDVKNVILGSDFINETNTSSSRNV